MAACPASASGPLLVHASSRDPTHAPQDSGPPSSCSSALATRAVRGAGPCRAVRQPCCRGQTLASRMVPLGPLLTPRASCVEAQCLSRYKGCRAPPDTCHGRPRGSPLVQSHSQVTPLAPSSYTTRVPRALCAQPRRSPRRSRVFSNRRRLPLLHAITSGPSAPNRALKTVASEPVGLPQLFPGQVLRSPRRNCGRTTGDHGLGRIAKLQVFLGVNL
jgi:hypothetical protein